ncbi:MAG: Hsp33 family molecular chaperone HslO [Clostridia bacterium]|nr:Hsp33 family molecular chaperone HslO [Clostridia bacterium]
MDAEKNIQIERREGDEILRGTLMDGQVRIMMCETTQMAQRAADIHNATPVCTAAMGRLMTATSMLGVMMKGENESVTVNIKGGGPMGTVVAVANHGDIKVCADDPQVELPLREDGKLNVGAAIGKDGYMTVIKDLGLREPYIGQIELVSGELGIDFANYYTVSEQQPSLVALGVLVAGDAVLKAGGLLIQPLPGCPDEVIDQIELRSPMFSDISREMTFAPKEELLEDWFRGMNLQILEREPLRYHCACSRYRMEKALISLGRKELQTLIDEDTGAELGCHFCHSQYAFSTQDLKELLERATRD